MPRIPSMGFLASVTSMAAMESLATIRLTCTTCDRVIAPEELSLGLCPGCASLMDCDELRGQADAATNQPEEEQR